MKKQKNKDLKKLSKAFSILRNREEIEKFLDDILTAKEIKEISNRLRIARLLYRKKGSYQQIAKMVKASTTTVTRTARVLNYGRSSLKTIFKRLLKK